jgi:teichuronic acid biosynthesis glycosyltransferase TuaG
MTPSLVSVVIPLFNAQDYIAATIESVLKQSYQSIELIVVDDSSTDDSPSVVRGFGSAVRYLHQENAGPAAARNRGIAAANGEYIAFLDADDEWLPNKVETQVNLLEESGADLGLVHSESLNIVEGQTKPKRTAKVLPAYMSPEAAFCRLFSGNFITTSTVMCRRGVFTELGSFDESMAYFSVEDYDMWLRILCQYGAAYVEEPLISYRVHAGGISKNINRSYENERNVLDKWYAESPDCMRRLTVSKRDRYRALYENWSADLSWNGDRLEAAKVSLKGMIRFGYSNTLTKTLLKTTLPR